jgi:hydrogenase expression/formation protein HypE
MRDPTRGGVASALHELATASRVSVVLDEASLPVRSEVRGACELLGLDLLHVANEGKVLVVVGREHVDSALAALRGHPLGRDAAWIGEVVAADGDAPMVRMRSLVGGERVVAMLAGEQLPRIC